MRARARIQSCGYAAAAALLSSAPLNGRTNDFNPPDTNLIINSDFGHKAR